MGERLSRVDYFECAFWRIAPHGIYFNLLKHSTIYLVNVDVPKRFASQLISSSPHLLFYSVLWFTAVECSFRHDSYSQREVSCYLPIQYANICIPDPNIFFASLYIRMPCDRNRTASKELALHYIRDCTRAFSKHRNAINGC